MANKKKPGGKSLHVLLAEKSSQLFCLSLAVLIFTAAPMLAQNRTPHITQTGIASWYGRPFHGRRTASGEIYDMNKLTAAHPSLPLSSELLVVNPRNGRQVVLKVTDRGPFIKNRVLDLSRAAANRLGILSCGVAQVKYTVINELRTKKGN